jgi:hypothetical protein
LPFALSTTPNHQVMELSENLKLRLENLAGENQPGKPARPAEGGADPGPIDEAESQMRRALGLLGEGQRHRPDPDRAEQPPHRSVDRFSGNFHRRRFVQDGDVPVTVLRRDQGQGHEQPAHRSMPAPQAPSSSRLQRTEAALANETAAREKAERLLADVQAHAHDLQTKIGHAELAKNEAIEALRRERDAITLLRAEARASREQLEEAVSQARSAEQEATTWQDRLTAERNAHKNTERALRTTETARDEAERLVRALSEESTSRRSSPAQRPHVEPEVAAVTSRRQRAAEAPAGEPEPVKWWLTPKPTAKRR